MMFRQFIIVSMLIFIGVQKGSAVDASIDYAVFKSQDSPYVELYFQILSKSLGFEVLDNGNARSTVNINVSISTLDGVNLINDSLVLNSPDGLSIVPDFKHVARYALKNGNYSVTVRIVDALRESKYEMSSFDLNINYNGLQVQQSMIQILSSYHLDTSGSIFTKNRIYYEVLPYAFCNNVVDELIVYNEVYGTKKYINDDFISHIWISGKGKKEIILERKKRTKAGSVVIILNSLNIEKLASGNYDIHIDILDRNNVLISSEKTSFQRLKLQSQDNEIVDNDSPSSEVFPAWVDTMGAKSLRYSLKAIFPLLEFYDVERLNQALAIDNFEHQKHFLFGFWASKSTGYEYGAFKRYMKVAKAVDKTFYSGFGYGFETDRGIIYLRYGEPDNSVSIDNEPGAFPYEIWKYNKIISTGRTNVKFIFYNKSLASNAYELLHSNAAAEKHEEKWERALYSGASSDDLPSNFIDAKGAGDGILRRAREYFDGM